MCLPSTPREEDLLERPLKFITDHEYVGNMCSGFGGRLECEMLDFETGRKCGASPFEHRYREPKHKGAYDKRETLEPYEARHRA